jgi:Chromo (CHRromatin Organisation MOdifier) domain
VYYHDQGCQLPKLQVGDEVLINPHMLALVDVKGHSWKLIQRKIGPFEITEIISLTAFRIYLPDTYPMHNVINIQHLMKYYSKIRLAHSLANPRDCLKSSEEFKEFEVDKIVDKQKQKGKSYYKRRWKGFNTENDTWQTAQDLRNAPELLKEWRLCL